MVFSIIIPLFNKEKSIVRCINSVLSQSFQDFEIIVVNDGSTDNSLFVVNQIKDSRIIVIDQLNGGVSSARNVGIINASNKYVAFLDADDYWSCDYLSNAANFINQHTQASLFGFSYFVKSDLKEVDTSDTNHLGKAYSSYIDNYFEVALGGHLFHISSTIVQRDFIIRNSIFFDERLSLGEDLDFIFRGALFGRVAFHNKSSSYYCLGAENRAMKSKIEIKKHLLYYLSKYDRYDSDAFNRFLSNFIVSYFPLLAFSNPTFLKVIRPSVDESLLLLKKKLIFNLPESFLRKLYLILYYRFLR